MRPPRSLRRRGPSRRCHNTRSLRTLIFSGRHYDGSRHMTSRAISTSTRASSWACRRSTTWWSRSASSATGSTRSLRGQR